MKSQNCQQVKNILVRKIFVLQKFFQRISNDIEGFIEAILLFMFDVLLSEQYYNEFIGCKIHSKHVSKLKENFKIK